MQYVSCQSFNSIFSALAVCYKEHCEAFLLHI